MGKTSRKKDTPEFKAQVAIEALELAIQAHGAPEIINSDQGCQYTSKEWLEACLSHEIKVSMDGRARCLDNIWIERYWRTIKREYIYLNLENNVASLRCGITGFIDYYNNRRCHQGTDAASERIINLLIMLSGQEEKAIGPNQPYSTKQALHSSGSLVLTKNNTVPV